MHPAHPPDKDVTMANVAEGADHLRSEDSRHRRSVRLKGFDYASPGAYFVTICTYDRAPLLGQVVSGNVVLSEIGRIVAEEWLRTLQVRVEVALDAWVIMPNHLHGILLVNPNAPVGAYGHTPLPVINDGALAGALAVACFRSPSHSLGAIVRGFKGAAARRVNAWRGTPKAPVWQRNYHEHIIRNERELWAIEEYIQNNPPQWEMDRDNPNHP
jgi:putative transposase